MVDDAWDSFNSIPPESPEDTDIDVSGGREALTCVDSEAEQQRLSSLTMVAGETRERRKKVTIRLIPIRSSSSGIIRSRTLFLLRRVYSGRDECDGYNLLSNKEVLGGLTL